MKPLRLWRNVYWLLCQFLLVMRMGRQHKSDQLWWWWLPDPSPSPTWNQMCLQSSEEYVKKSNTLAKTKRNMEIRLLLRYIDSQVKNFQCQHPPSKLMTKLQNWPYITNPSPMGKATQKLDHNMVLVLRMCLEAIGTTWGNWLLSNLQTCHEFQTISCQFGKSLYMESHCSLTNPDM
jgi:hypothetical protein